MPTTTRQPDPRSFDRLPAVFDRFAQLVGGPLDDYLTGHLPTHGERAVDLGCGTGSHAWQLSRVFDNVRAVDISAPMLAHARRHRPAGTIHYQRRDLTDVTPGRDGRFDFVLFTHTLHHVPDLRFALELIRSLVKPGGQIVLIDNVDPRRQAPRSWFRSEARKALLLDVRHRRRPVRDAVELYRLSTHAAWLDHLSTDEFLTPAQFEAVYGAVLPRRHLHTLLPHARRALAGAGGRGGWVVSGPHRVADETAAGALRAWYEALPVSRPARMFCPRCGSQQVADYGTQVGCGPCGATWQAEAPVAEPVAPR